MNEYIHCLGEEIVLSTLDANSGCLQIKIDGVDRDKTASTSSHSLYEFIEMPFSLKNAQTTSHRATDLMLVSVQWQFALVYLDDIVIFSKSPADHIEQDRRVSRMIYEFGVSLKLKKGKFFAETIHHLSHVLRSVRL